MRHQVPFSVVELWAVFVVTLKDFLLHRHVNLHVIFDIWFAAEILRAEIAGETCNIFVDASPMFN